MLLRYSSHRSQPKQQPIRKYSDSLRHVSQKSSSQDNKNMKNALAIGISEAKRKGYKAGERWKKSERKK